MSAPTVSAVVTAHDRRAFLPEAVRSALDAGADEVLVVRNFDGTIAGAEGRYRDVRCDLAPTGEKQARGVELATGELVALLDDDDRWVAGKLDWVRREFGTDPSLVYLSNAQRPIDGSGQPISASHPELSRPHPERFGAWDGRDFPTLVHTIWPGNSSSTSLRRTWANGWLASLRAAAWGADLFWLVAALADRRPIRILPEPLTELRLHDQNMSHRRDTTAEAFRAHHEEVCERFARSMGVLASVAEQRLGPRSSMGRYLRQKEAAFAFLAALEADERPRRAAFRGLTHGPGRSDRGVTLTALAALVSPGYARAQLYRASQRRWAIAPAPRQAV